MPQDSVRSEKGYPLHLARRIRTTRPQHHQQIQGKGQGEDQRGLHATGAGACGTRLHNIGRGVHRRDEDRIEGQQIHVRLAEIHREEQGKADEKDRRAAGIDRRRGRTGECGDRQDGRFHGGRPQGDGGETGREHGKEGRAGVEE